MSASRKNPVVVVVLGLAGLGRHLARKTVFSPPAMKIWRRVGIVGGSVLAVLLLVSAFLTWRSGRELAAALQELKDRGEPLRSVDAAPAAVAESENAAPLLEKAFALQKSDQDEATIDAITEFEEGRETANVALVEKHLAANAESLTRTAEAVRRTKARFPVDYSQGFLTELPHLMKIKEAVSLLALRARVEARRGDGDAALETLGIALRVPRALDDEPFLISHLVRIACDGIAIDALVDVLSRSEPSAAACRNLQTALEPLPREALGRAFRGERAGALDFFGAFRRGDKSLEEILGPTSNAYTWGSRLSSWVVHRDELAYLDVIGATIEAVSRPSPRAVLAAVDLAAQRPIPSGAFMTWSLMPALQKCVVKYQEARVRRDMARFALDLRVERLTRGRYPETATAPEDPFAPGQVKYRREGPGFVVWSVGRDRSDEGGVTSGDRDVVQKDLTLHVSR